MAQRVPKLYENMKLKNKNTKKSKIIKNLELSTMLPKTTQLNSFWDFFDLFGLRKMHSFKMKKALKLDKMRLSSLKFGVRFGSDLAIKKVLYFIHLLSSYLLKNFIQIEKKLRY